MNKLNKLGLIFSVGTLAAFAIAGCSDDTTTPTTTAGTSAGGTAAGTGTTAGTGGAAAGTGTTGGAGAAGTAAGGGGSGGAAAGTGGGGSGGAAAGSGGTGGGGAGGGGGSGGMAGGGGNNAGPMCADDDDPANMMPATCDSYCTTYITNCGPAVNDSPTKNFYADKNACMADCNSGFKAKQTGTVDASKRLCCEAYHARNAATMGLNHCEHAVAMSVCSGT